MESFIWIVFGKGKYPCFCIAEFIWDHFNDISWIKVGKVKTKHALIKLTLKDWCALLKSQNCIVSGWFWSWKLKYTEISKTSF